MFKQNQAAKQIILEEIEPSDPEEPEEDEIREYAKELGINVEEEPELIWIARAGINAPLPQGWKPVEMKDGQMYFYNFESNQSSWEHPGDEKYRQMVLEERRKLQLKHNLTNKKKPTLGEVISKAPLRPASVGKLTPIGGIGGNISKPAAPIAPITKPELRKEPPILQKDGKQIAERPKTSRGAGRPSSAIAENESHGEVKVRGGGSRFLKVAPHKDEPALSSTSEEILKQGSVEILRFHSEHQADEESSEEQAPGSLKSSLNLGGSLIVLDASDLESPTKPAEHRTPPPPVKPEVKRSGHETLLRRDSEKPSILGESFEQTSLKAIGPIKEISEERILENKLRDIKEEVRKERAREEERMRKEVEEERKVLREELEKERKDAEAELEKQRKNAKAELEKQRKDAEAELVETRQRLERERKEAVEHQGRELAQLRRRLSEEAKNQHESNAHIASAKKKAEMERKYEEELRDIQADYEALLNKKTAELKRKAAEIHEIQVAPLRQDLSELKNQVEQISALTMDLKTELSSLLDQSKRGLENPAEGFARDTEEVANVIVEAKEFLAKDDKDIPDSAIDLNEFGESEGDISQNLFQMGIQLRTLSSKIHQLSGPNRPLLILSNPNYAEAFIRNRWDTFSQTGVYPSSEEKIGGKVPQLSQLKTWLRELERRVGSNDK